MSSTVQTRPRRPILTLKAVAKPPVAPVKAKHRPKAKATSQPKAEPRTLTKSQARNVKMARIAKAATLSRRRLIADAKAALAAQAPLVFDPVAPKPLAIGISHEIARGFNLSHNMTSLLMFHWTSRIAYLKATAAGGPRYGLDGCECGVVTDKEIAYAKARLAERGEA